MYLVKVGAFASYSAKFTLFWVSGLKDEKFIKNQTCMKTETCKPYSRVLWIFLPNIIKIGFLGIISSYTVSKLVHFLRHSV